MLGYLKGMFFRVEPLLKDMKNNTNHEILHTDVS